jgi:hypothetical protein
MRIENLLPLARETGDAVSTCLATAALIAFRQQISNSVRRH